MLRLLVELCGRGSFELVKIASNSTKVLEAVPEELRAKGFKDPGGEHDELRVLGLIYDVKEDNLRVRCDKKLGGGSEKEFHTRRDVLSAVMGIFDPLGQVAPFVLKGKKLNQRLCTMKYDWVL